MVRLIAGCIAVAWAFAGWRNLPRLDHPSALAAGLAIGGTCAISYFCGKTLTKNSAYASARAYAEARAAAVAQSKSQAAANVNLFMGNPELGASYVAAQQLGGLDGASWIGSRKQEAEQDVLVQMVEDGGQLEEVGESA